MNLRLRAEKPRQGRELGRGRLSLPPVPPLGLLEAGADGTDGTRGASPLPLGVGPHVPPGGLQTAGEGDPSTPMPSLQGRGQGAGRGGDRR